MFRYSKDILFKPRETWSIIAEKATLRNSTYGYAYIFMLIIAGCRFFSEIAWNDATIGNALVAAFVSGATIFTGLYLAAFLCRLLYRTIAKNEASMEDCLIFVSYNSTILYLTSIVECLIVDMFFVGIFNLYMIRTIIEGYQLYFKIGENKKNLFVIAVCVTTMASYGLMGYIIRRILL